MSVNSPKLLSGRVPVTPYGNLTSDRYQFLGLSQAEPSLGAGDANSVLTLGTNNARVWSNALNLTSVIVSSANVTGTLTVSNVSVGNITGTGDLIFGNVYANSGTVRGALLTGTLTTNAQPNITQIGTLSSLNITGDITSSGNIYANSGTVRGALLVGTLTTNAQPNITQVGTLASLNVTGDTTSSGNIYANSGTVKGALLVGTLTTNAQPNITQVGLLSNLTVGNSTANVVFGNGTINAAGSIQSNGAIYANTLASISTSGVTITAVGSNSNINLLTNGTGNIVLTANTNITGVAYTPINPGDVASKNYVDTVAQGLSVKESVLLATTAALPAYTYNNGTSGVGATITANAVGALSIDSTLVTANTRILVKNETSLNTPYNGIYLVTDTGNATANFILTRTLDFDSSNSNVSGSFTFVEQGTNNASTGWVCTATPPVSFGVTYITFTQFSGTGTYTAGTGLTLTGTQFSITDTTVTAGTYGNGDAVATFTVNQQGQLTAASNVSITANAANLSGTTLASSIVNSSLTSVGTLGSLSVTANVTAGNVYANSGTIGASLLTGTLTTSNQPNISNVGTLGNLNVTSNIISGNVYANSGTIGSNLLTANYVTGILTTNAQPNITSVGLLSNLTVGNTTANTIFGNGTITATGNVSGGNLSTAGIIQATGNITSTANVIGGNLTTTGVVSATGNVSGGNLTTTGVVSATGNVSGGNLTTTGALSVTGNANVGNIGAAIGVFTSNVTASNVYANSGTVGATYLTGTLTTNAQPNVTSLGTLGNLSVTSNITTGNIYANTGNANIGNLTVNGILIANVQISNLSNGNSNISILANSNINISSNGVPNVFTVTYTGVNVSGTLNATGNANVGNLVTDTAIIATGNITTINSGVIQNGNSVIAITANGNINFTATSVDVLTVSSTGANISGTANVTGNLYASNLSVGTGNIISGNVSGGNLVSASYLQGTLTTAAQPNITSVGTLTSLNVGGTSNLGPVGNVTITGGTSGYYLQTNGSGVLTWAAVPTGTSISNGNSNVNIPVANGNVNISSDGNANVLVVTGTGANITGTANITGNIYAANANISGIAYATSFVPGSLQVTTTPSGSTTLLANSAAYLIISGTYGWTVNLPLESTLVLGQSYTINNNTGSGVIVKNNAGTTLFTVPSGGITQFIYDGVTGTNNWDYHSFLPYEYSAGGNLLQLGNSTTEVDLSVYGNITAQTGYQFIGNGFSLTSTNGANVVGNVTSAITANYANYAGNITIASQPNITEVGTLGNLLVSNNANVGNLLVSTNANVLGTLYTGNIVAANGNISITGNSINVANAIIANTATINGNLTAGNVNGGNLVQANYFIGNGVGITGLTLANSLSDVTISSPTLNQVIGYNGAYWVNQTPQTTTSAGSGVTFWFTGPTVIPTNANNYVEVDTLSSTPNTATVSYLSGNIPTNSTAVFGALQSGVLGRTALDAGTWTYGIWANANAVNAGTVTITGITYSTTPFTTGTVTLTGTGTSRTATASADSPFATAVGSSDPNVASYLQTPNALMQITAVANSTSVTVTTLSTYVNETAVSGNVWNELFLVGSANLTATLTEYNFNTTQGTYVISNTASLGILITATSTRSQSTNVSVTLNGTTTASSVKTPLITLHDNLAGLQGGQSNEYFHLTQAEYTGTGTGNFVRQTSPTLITPNIGAATGTSLDTTGNITASNVYANSGTIGASLLTGTLTTAAQPNITSVGTLSSLSVTGNVTAGNLTGSLANGNSNVYIPSANGNVDITAVGNTTLIVTGTGVNVSGTLNATGNANVGNLGFGSGVITGTGNITGGNIIGTIAAGSNTITTTGNITGGNIIGIIAAGSNAITTTGNITSGNANLGNLVQANFATVTLTTTAANQSNITTVGTLTTLNVSGTSNLGPVSNVTITGGSSGQYLQTNGSGVLTWAVIPTSSIISNGNSNVSIPSGNGNVNIWTNGTKKWVFDTTGNLTTPSGILIDTNSNISNANIITANYLVASSGCVTIGGSTISVVGSDAGIFVGTVTNISMGLNANLSMGSATGTVTVNNDLQANGNITSNANIIANSNIISNANITATNTVTAANVAVGDLYSSRAPVSVGTGNVIVDQFPLSTYRSAKYTIKAGSDNGYQALEVLLVHDSINSIITVYGSLSTSGSDLVILNSTIAGGNVQLYALGLYANTVVNLMGTYVPD